MNDEVNDIDELMARLDDPDYIANIPTEDLIRIIAYQRKMRAQREAGVKVRKPKAEAKPTISIEQMLAKLPPAPKGGIKRRF
jgi:hypothetical protein